MLHTTLILGKQSNAKNVFTNLHFPGILASFPSTVCRFFHMTMCSFEGFDSRL